ncbi:hypothetical protein MUB24_20350 [Lederbergia sp. NSJ-179]|uniref:hypothetical protein n=1 Tax=Lederbergia sp. NSJ-179 TaxID=2931402 RepID=UPI001FD53163|nr:hypothetical protein [Lederbergia sp. NSJ-179]MCJ7843183.1 hypothetical protein [Lederbergia sp. NSJ-179]
MNLFHHEKWTNELLLLTKTLAYTKQTYTTQNAKIGGVGMAFSLSQATGKSYPLPWAPQIRRKYRSVLISRIGALLVRWVAVIGVFTWFCAAWVLALLPSWIMEIVPTAGWALLLFIAVALFLLRISGDSVKTPLIRTLGYGRAGINTVSGRHSKPSESLAHLTSAIACGGASLGIVLGTAVAFVQAAISSGLAYESSLLMPFGAGLAGLVGLLASAAVRMTKKTIAGWRDEMKQEQIASDVLAHGKHVVGKVTKVKFAKSWLDQQPIFNLCVEYEAADETRTIKFHYVDYPKWAPVIGNEFEIWFDPDQPDDPRYILLERKIVGQTFASEIEYLRRPAAGGDGPALGPAEPEWAQPENHNRTTTTVKLAFQLIFAILFATGSAAAIIAWIMVFGASPWWMLPCLLILTAAFSLNVICGVSLLKRSQWLIRTTWAVDTVGWIAYTFMFPTITGVAIKTATLLWDTTSSLPVEQVVVLVFTGFVAVVGGIASVISSTTFHEIIARVFTAGTVPPAEEVHEALRSSDPGALETLEKRYNYIAGALHTRC